MSDTKEHNSGIYVIEIEGYEKFYIGSSIDFKRRKNQHLRALRKKSHNNQYLQNLYNKYGEKSFKFKLFIYTGVNKEYLLKLEQRIIDSYNWDELINCAKFAGTPKGYYPEFRMFKEEDVKNIFKLASDGKSIKYISKIYKVESYNIYNIIRRFGYLDIKINKSILELAQKNISNNKNKKFTEEEIQIIKDNYLTIKTGELAKKLGRNRNSITTIAKKYGLTKKVSVWTKELDDFVIKNYKLLGAAECARFIGISKKSLSDRVYVLKRAGNDIGIKKIKKDYKNRVWTEDKIEFIKTNSANGSKFLANYFNVTTDAILAICKKNKINVGRAVWSNKEIDILMNNYKLIGSKKCSKILNRSISSIKLKYNYELKRGYNAS